jgi:hypothetical protein
MAAITKQRYDQMKARLSRMRESAKEAGDEAKKGVAVGLSAFGIGMLDEAYGPQLVGDFDNSTIAAVLGLGAAASGLAGEWTEYVKAFGTAGLSISAYRFGVETQRERAATTDRRGSSTADEIRRG